MTNPKRLNFSALIYKEKLTFNQQNKTCFPYISKYINVGVLPIRIVQSNVSGVGHLSKSIYNARQKHNGLSS